MAGRLKNLLGQLNQIIDEADDHTLHVAARQPQTLEQRRAKAAAKTRKLNAYRIAHGGIQINATLDAASAACVLYLEKQWGFKSRRELIRTAILYLAKQTRAGLERIDV